MRRGPRWADARPVLLIGVESARVCVEESGVVYHGGGGTSQYCRGYHTLGMIDSTGGGGGGGAVIEKLRTVSCSTEER